MNDNSKPNMATREQILKRYPNANERFIQRVIDADSSGVRPAAPKPVGRVSLAEMDIDGLIENCCNLQMQSAINPDLVLARYRVLKNIHAAGAEFGICGETARRILKRAGHRLFNSDWTPVEKEALKKYYSQTAPENFSADEIAGKLNRTVDSIYIMASRLDLTDNQRPKTENAKKAVGEAQRIRLSNPEARKFNSDATKKWLSGNPHPKGMLGKNHTQEARDTISKSQSGSIRPRESVLRGMKTRISKYGTIAPNIRRGSWAAGWRTIGGVEKYFRSRWEANYARFLEFQKSQGLVLSWQHEPETFWFDKVKRGCVSYLPDFKVTLPSGAIEFHEVKGWMDDKSKTKIKRMAKYHPEIKLVIKDSVWFRSNSNLKGIISDWE